MAERNRAWTLITLMDSPSQTTYSLYHRHAKKTVDFKPIGDFSSLDLLDIHYLYPGHGRPILGQRPLNNVSVEW